MHLCRSDQRKHLHWYTNVSVFFDHYDRGAINAQEDPRWGAGEHRPFVDDDSPWKTSTAFRNTSTNSNYPQMDMVSSATSIAGTEYDKVFTDSAESVKTLSYSVPAILVALLTISICG